MRILRDINNLPADLKGAVYAIGNFDGLHRGHRAVIEAAGKAAQRIGRACAIITFEPHSRNFFRPDLPRARLTPLRIKAELLAKMGVDILINLRFNRRLAGMSARDFVKDVLQTQLAVSHIAIGENFRFGAQRQGDAFFLADEGQKNGFSVDIIKPIQEASTAISSTAIRNALAAGEVEKAAKFLGRWWQIAGAVQRGEQRGQKLGFPTLNLALDDYAALAFGVYAARCHMGGQTYDAVINAGQRPTFGGSQPLLEAHLFGASGDFYGAQARIFPLRFLRPEKRFDGAAALKKQIAEDCAAAQTLCREIAVNSRFDFMP